MAVHLTGELLEAFCRLAQGVHSQLTSTTSFTAALRDGNILLALVIVLSNGHHAASIPQEHSVENEPAHTSVTISERVNIDEIAASLGSDVKWIDGLVQLSLCEI